MRKLLLQLLSILFSFQTLQAQRYEKIADVFPTPDLTAEGHKFGTSVAVDGDFAAVSDPTEGAVHVLQYSINQWQRVAKLTYPKASPLYASDGAVAMRGDVVAVAAPHVGSLGTVFVFEKPAGGWVDTEASVQLTPDTDGETASIFANFATSVSITTTGILVGSERSAAYLFEKIGAQWSTMTQTATLSSPAGVDSFDRFGRYVCYLDTVALLSADGLNSSTGGVYTFRRQGVEWSNTNVSTLLTPADAKTGDYFGASIDGFFGHVVIGAPGADKNGAAYVFEGSLRSNSQQAKLTDPDGFYSGLGASVSITYSTIVVGTKNSKSVYVYEVDRVDYEWKDATPTAVLSAPTSTTSTDYTVSLHPSSGTILAGARELGAGGTLYAYQRTGNAWTDTSIDQEFTATKGLSAIFDSFGSDVAIDGDYAVVASPGDDQAAPDAGAAYVLHYKDGNWNKVAKLMISKDDEGYTSMNGVAISGNTVVVGYYQTSGKAAYVYVKPPGGWQDMTETAVLTATAPYENHTLGDGIAIQDDVVAISASGFSADAVLVYQKPAGGWMDITQTAALTGSDTENSDSFGSAISISGSTIVAGDPGYNTIGGAAYVFERSGSEWHDMTQTAKLTVSDPRYADALGSAIDIQGETIIAGAPGREFAREAAFVFEKPLGGWQDITETVRLTRSSNSKYVIGHSVAISNNAIVVEGYNQALVYYKPVAGWTDRAETSAITLDGSYSRAVAISSNIVLVGSRRDDTQGLDAGVTQFYRIKPNNPPASQSIADQTASAGDAFSFTINENLFSDIDNDDLSYSATREDGSPLPAWLSFNGTTRTFQGQPASEDVGSIFIKIVVSDSYAEVSTNFKITIQESANPEDEPNEGLPEENDETEEPVAEETEADDEETETEDKQPETEGEQPVVDSEKDQGGTVTGTDDELVGHEILLYPNPSVGQFSIRSATETILQITITNGQGQTIINKNYIGNRDNTVINVLPRGIYQVQIQTRKQTTSYRLIVQ